MALQEIRAKLDNVPRRLRNSRATTGEALLRPLCREKVWLTPLLTPISWVAHCGTRHLHGLGQGQPEVTLTLLGVASFLVVRCDFTTLQDVRYLSFSCCSSRTPAALSK